MCRIKCEPKCLIYPCSLQLHYKRDTCTQLFFSEFCIILINNFLLDHSWASAYGFIFDIFKSNKELKVSFLLPVFYRKSKIKPKNRVALKLGNLRFALLFSGEICENGWLRTAAPKHSKRKIFKKTFLVESF